MLEKCEGIILRSSSYGETNKIVTIYSKEWGKIGVMARGAKKPASRLSGITLPFTYAYFLVQKSKGLSVLQQGETIQSFKKIKADIFLTAYVSYMAELLDKATEEKKPNPYLFELFLQCIEYMEEGYDAQIIMHIFEMKMLTVLGITPHMQDCVICHSSEGTFSFSLRHAGIICHACKSQDAYVLQVSDKTIRLLRVFYYFDLNRLGTISVSEQTKKEISHVLETYLIEYAGITLKTRRFLKQMDLLK